MKIDHSAVYDTAQDDVPEAQLSGGDGGDGGDGGHADGRQGGGARVSYAAGLGGRPRPAVVADKAADQVASVPPASQTLVRGLDVLEQVGDGPVPLAVLAQRLGLSRSTVHRLATTLVERRFLNMTPRRGYTLGPKLLALGSQAREQINLVRLAEPALEVLAETTGDVALLGVRDGAQMLLAHRTGGRRAISPSIRPGERLDLARSAIGMALLLDEDEAGLTALWRAGHVAANPSTLVGFLARMAAAREAGLVCDRGEADPQICAVAAPVRDADGQIRAAVCSAAARAYFCEEELTAACEAVREAALAIGGELGWQVARILHGPAGAAPDAANAPEVAAHGRTRSGLMAGDGAGSGVEAGFGAQSGVDGAAATRQKRAAV